MSSLIPTSTRPREDGDTSDRPRQRRRTDAPQVPYIIELDTQTLEGHSRRVNSVSFSADGTKLASGSSREVKLWDVTSGECLHTLDIHTEVVSLSPDGTKVVSGFDYTGEINLLDVNTGTRLFTVFHNDDNNDQELKDLAFSPDGSKIASVSDNEMLKIWNTRTGNLSFVRNALAWIFSVAFSPDGSKVAIGSADGIDLWDINGQYNPNIRLNENRLIVHSVSFSPDGTKVASESFGELKLWDVTSRVCLQTLEGHSSTVRSLSFSPDGTKLASGSSSQVKVWDLTSGTCLQTLDYHGLLPGSLKFSPDGLYLRIVHRADDNNRAIHITTYLAKSWLLRDAKNMLRAFAIRQFQGDPLPFVRRMYPGFYDGERYIFLNEDEGTIERKTEQEIIDWYNDRLAEEQARQTPNAVRRNIEIVALKF